MAKHTSPSRMTAKEKQEQALLNELRAKTNDLVRFCRDRRIPVYVVTEPEGVIESAKRTVTCVTPEELNLVMDDDNVTKLALMNNENLRLTPVKPYQNEERAENDALLDQVLSEVEEDGGEEE